MAKAIAKPETQIVVTQRMRETMAVEFPPLPEILDGKIDTLTWRASLLGVAPYKEPDPDYLAREMAMNIFLTEDDETALMGSDLPGLQDILEDFPGNTTGAIRILDLYVAYSFLEQRHGTFLIFSWYAMETGDTVRCTAGSTSVQWGFLRYLRLGVWPIECQIVRDKATDQGGKHLLKLWPVDAR